MYVHITPFNKIYPLYPFNSSTFFYPSLEPYQAFSYSSNDLLRLSSLGFWNYTLIFPNTMSLRKCSPILNMMRYFLRGPASNWRYKFSPYNWLSKIFVVVIFVAHAWADTSMVDDSMRGGTPHRARCWLWAVWVSARNSSKHPVGRFCCASKENSSTLNKKRTTMNENKKRKYFTNKKIFIVQEVIKKFDLFLFYVTVIFWNRASLDTSMVEDSMKWEIPHRVRYCL